jgi:hypothetical protein
MWLREILVLEVMRQGLNNNYDQLHYCANSDSNLNPAVALNPKNSLKGE